MSPHALSCKTPPGIPNTAGKTPAWRRPCSQHGGDPAPGTVTGYYLHSIIWEQREQDTCRSVHGWWTEPYLSFPICILQEKSRWDALGPSEPGLGHWPSPRMLCSWFAHNHG